MNTKNLLLRAKAIISERDKWTTHAAARRADGLPVAIRSPHACKFCITGAIEKARLCLFLKEDCSAKVTAHQLLCDAARRIANTDSIVLVNDKEGFTAVHAILDDAIQAAT